MTNLKITASKEVVFWFTVPIFILAVLLTISVISVAIFFQKLRRKIEAEIDARNRDTDEPVRKMTVKKRRKQNKYQISRKKKDDPEPEFYISPPMTDRHRDALEMKALQQDSQFVKVNRLSIPHSSGTEEESYIECIGNDEPLRRMTTFQSALAAPKQDRVTQYRGQTMSRSSGFEGSYIECINREEPEAKPLKSQAATLPAYTALPTTKDFGHGFKDSSLGTVTQEQVSRNTNCHLTSGKGRNLSHGELNNPILSDEETYEIMEQDDEFYENAGYTNDLNDDLYGNQEILEQEYKRRSQGDTWHHDQIQEPTTTWHWHNGRTTEYQDFETEIYENQEIVEAERKKREKCENVGVHRRASDGNSSASLGCDEHIDLYENYVEEDMYQNC